MESDSGTSTPEPQLLSSPQSSHHSDPPVTESFTLTRDAIQVLEGYVDAFQEANADCRSGIIANVERARKRVRKFHGAETRD